MYFFEFSLLILVLFVIIFILFIVIDFFKLLILMEICFLFLSLLFLFSSFVLDDFYGQFFILEERRGFLFRLWNKIKRFLKQEDKNR